MPFATLDGIKTHYVKQGSGPFLLMMAPRGFESTLQSWVKNVKDEGDVAAGETPLTQAEKKRIRDLEAELRRVNMENAFLKKASAYFASQNL